MGKRTKKIICTILAFLLLINNNILTVNAATDINVNVITNPKVDIMLTSKQTGTNLETFETDVIKSLKNKGINTSNINFTTVERVTTSFNQDAASASQIMSTWDQYPNPNAYTVYGNYILNNALGDGYFPVGSIRSFNQVFIKNEMYESEDLSIEADINIHHCEFSSGLVIKYDPTTDIAYLALANNCYRSGYPYCQSITLVKATNFKKYLGVYPNYSVVENQAQVLASANSSTYGILYIAGGCTNLNNASATFNMRAEYKKDTGIVNIYVNDKLAISHYVGDIKGGPGLYAGCNAAFQNVMVESATESIKTFKDVLTEPKWREDAKRIVVNVDDTIDNTLTGESTIGEILSRTLADDIHFIQWGTNTNKSVSETFISRNDNKGKFTYNTNYSQAVEDTANYIKNLITQETTTQYVIVGQDTSLIVTPESYKTGATSTDFPNGRWKIHHNYTYYDNNLGQSNQTEIYSPNLMCNFDKPGEYIIYFDNQEVKRVYAHRKPIADFNITISNSTLTLTNTSYDLDKNTNKGYGPGIASENWYYKEATATSWSSGKLTTFDKSKIYVIKLEVTDLQGTSSYTTKYVGTGNPVANFNYGSETISKYRQLVINNTSYDPEGYAITGYSWVLKKNGMTMGTYTTPIINFNTTNLGLGDYSYTLTVTNSKGTKSEAFTKNFTVIDDTDKPEVIANPTSCTWKSSQVVSLTFSDADSGFKNWRYCSTTSQTAPASTDTIWSSWNTNANSTATVTGTTTGEYYLHLQAYDKAGNLLERSIGLYQIDKTKPVVVKMTSAKGSINQNKITVTATDDHSGMYSYAISTTNTQPTSFQSSNVLTATQLGSHYIWVKDNAGNVNSTTYNVTEMDFSITTNCGTTGTISNYSISKSYSSTSIVIIPSNGFKIKDVVVDGTSVGAKSTYDFWNITESHTVTATFERDTAITTILNNLKNKYDWITFK